MGARRGRVPVFETLEGRVVLSRAAITVGALGDSYTDEYRFYPPDRSAARGWVEILAATQRADFGPFAARGRGEPRNGGFALNWARSDAESPDVVDLQLPGLARQVATGRVKYAWVFMGGNDFLHYAQRLAVTPPASSDALAADVQRIAATAAENFDRSVLTLLAADPRVRLVVATVPTFRNLPIFRPFAGLPGAGEAAAVIEQGLLAYNDHIRAVAASSGRIALADLATLYGPVSGGDVAAVPFDGITVDLVNPGNAPRNFFLADGLHVGTIGQGLIADAFLAAIRTEFGARVAPLTPGQIVHFARAVAARNLRR